MTTFAPFIQNFFDTFAGLVKNEIVPGVPLLYHYTTAEGIFGIVREKELWLTNVNYLNDKSECIHAFELCEELLEAKVKNNESSIFNVLLNGFREIRKDEGFPNVFVGSLSTLGDQLSQWRGYSRYNGLSLGFDYPSLHQHVGKQEMAIFPCVYSEEKKISAIETFIKAYARFKNNGSEPGRDYKWRGESEKIFAGSFHEMLGILSPILKNNAFSEESEYRIVYIKPKTGENPESKYRLKNGIIVSYIPCKVEMPFLRKILVGPSNKSELMMKSISDFVGNQIEVIPSKVPFREL